MDQNQFSAAATGIRHMPRRSIVQTLIAFAFCFLFSVTALAEKPSRGGGGGGGGDGGSAVAIVDFEVTWLGTLGGTKSAALAVNNSGETVGWSLDAGGNYRATLFLPTGPIDINVLISDLISARLDGSWTAWIAADINDLGQIAGSIRPASGISHPFIYDPGDTGSGRPRKLEILEQIYGETTRGSAINNLGDVTGDYFGNGGGAFLVSPGGPLIDMGPVFATSINDVGQVAFWDPAVGASWRYTPDQVLGDAGEYTPFPGGGLDINAYGEVTGATHTEIRRNKYVDTIYRSAGDPSTDQLLYEGSSAGFPFINDQRDVGFMANDRLKLFTDKNSLGLVDIDSLVTGDASTLNKWSSGATIPQEITNRDDSGFPIICGYGHPFGGGSISEAFILVPRLK